MSTLVVGSIALDTIETPFGKTEDALGGTAVFFSVAACHFTNVNVVGVVGHDFPESHITLLEDHGCDLEGLQRIPGRTFRWRGSYSDNMNLAHTLDTQLNVFEAFHPQLPARYRQSDTLFLGNIDPDLQMDVLRQTDSPDIVALDTMNFWIAGKRTGLEAVMRHVDILLINEDEARQFADVFKISEAARYIHEFGPRFVVVKRGEYGSALFTPDSYFALPAFLTENVRDTTGAGDSFAGGFLGYLDSVSSVTDRELRRAMAYGTVMASFTVEDFSIGRIHAAGKRDIEDRFTALRELTAIEPVENMEAITINRGA